MQASSSVTKPIEPVETGFADFQNEALLGSAGSSADGGKVLSHEDAAHEKRNWVRLSYDCNNHCTFCLDSNAHDGTMRADRDIRVQIVEGRKKGASRLILSGGELLLLVGDGRVGQERRGGLQHGQGAHGHEGKSPGVLS